MKALGILDNPLITIVIVGIKDKNMNSGGGRRRRRLNTDGAEIIYEVRIRQVDGDDKMALSPSDSPANSADDNVGLMNVNSIKSKMTALALVTSSDGSNTVAGAEALSAIKTAVASQAGVSLVSISAGPVSTSAATVQIIEPNTSSGAKATATKATVGVEATIQETKVVTRMLMAAVSQIGRAITAGAMTQRVRIMA